MANSAFDNERFRQAYPPGIERSWWHVARNRVIADAFARHVPRDAQVIEVGCGTGIVTMALRGRGWQVTGVELGDPPLGQGADKYILTGTNALELPPERRASFTAMALFDVLEHVEDAPAFLRSLLQGFPNVRQVVVTVPARNELWSAFDEHYGHFRRYDRRMLKDELESACLGAAAISYFFHGLYPAIGLNNLLRGRKRDIRFKAPAPGLSTFVNKAIGACFALEARLLPAALAGSSLIAVANRT